MILLSVKIRKEFSLLPGSILIFLLLLLRFMRRPKLRMEFSGLYLSFWPKMKRR